MLKSDFMQHQSSTTTLTGHSSIKELLLGVYVRSMSNSRVLLAVRSKVSPQQISKASRITTRIGLLIGALLLTVFVVGSVIFLPAVYYQLFPAEVIKLQPTQPGTVVGGQFKKPTNDTLGRQYTPPVSESLPEGDWVIIPQIGVRTQFLASEDPNQALAQGAWLSPDYARPGEVGIPVIIAAHRFGWDWWWQSDYGKYHSFYYLPDTTPGTQVEVISGKRKWVYEIYAGEEGNEISDYSADLILYTCKHISSPVRYIRYARLLDPTANTQVVQEQ